MTTVTVPASERHRLLAGTNFCRFVNRGTCGNDMPLDRWYN